MSEQTITDIWLLDGYIARCIEPDDGERIYLLRILDTDGITHEFAVSQRGMELIRQENERAMLSGIFG